MIHDPDNVKCARRGILFGSVAAAALLGARAAFALGEQTPVQQPEQPSPEAFMERAFALRDQALSAGDQGYGAVVVRDGALVGLGPSRVVTNGDPTAHAEMEAIRDAARRLGRRDLSGLVMYSSSRPCPMCEAAAYWAGLGRLVYGRGLADSGAPRLGRC